MARSDRSVFIEGDASGAVIFTGDGNNYFHVSDPETAEAILRRIQDQRSSLAEQPDVAPLPHLTLRFRRADPEVSGGWTVTSSVPSREPRDDGEFLVDGEPRHWTPPWEDDPTFDRHLHNFWTLASRVLDSDEERATLHGSAVALGRSLASVLLDSEIERLEAIARGDDGPPLLVLDAEEDRVLALPWELLHWHEPGDPGAERWPVRDGRLDLARTTPAPGATILAPPTEPLSLLINVSAPEGSRLDYEAESYKISRALQDHAAVATNETGELDDLVLGLSGDNPPLGVHFSGSGGPGRLDFEDRFGRADTIEVARLLDAIRSEAHRLPRFFYLASCHGNTPRGRSDRGQLGGKITSSAAHLHRGGIPQVVGHFGLVHDSQILGAEEALYRGLAEGKRTRVALRSARRSLARGSSVSAITSSLGTSGSSTEGATPLAWAQLVLYHRGPDHPLGRPVPQRYARLAHTPLRRRATPAFGGSRTQVLVHGFVGRRSELHQLRRDLDTGRHLHVVQGLGGLGKSAFCQQVLQLHAKQGRQVLGLWCADVESSAEPIAALVQQFQSTAEGVLGSVWRRASAELERRYGLLPSGRRLAVFLEFLMAQGPIPPLVLYLDNLESLMTSPDLAEPEDPEVDWRNEDCAELWRSLVELSLSSAGQLALLASCRYRHPDFDRWRLPLPPLGRDALFRMTGWFGGLRQLATTTRERLTLHLSGHPRSVEMLDALIDDAIQRWRDTRGALPPGDEQWSRLVEPALPGLEAELGENLLFEAIWSRVLGDAERAALVCSTVLRRPASWDFLLGLVGSELVDGDDPDGDDPDGDDPDGDDPEVILRRLLRCSLLMEFRPSQGEAPPEFATHRSVVRLVLGRQAESAELRHCAFLVAARQLENAIEHSDFISLPDLHDLGYYLVSAGRVDEALESLWPHAEELSFRFHRHREALELLGETLPAIELAGKEGCAKLHGVAAGCLMGLGNLAGARLAAERALALQSELADQAPGDTHRQRDLSVAYIRKGDVLQSQGDSEGALGAFRAALDIREHLTRMDPDGLGWQRDLSTVQERLGDAFVGQGNLEGATPVLQSAQAIRERLTRIDPENTAWQRDLSVIQSKLGKVLRARGDHAGALEVLRQSLAIAERLARAAPDDARWQRDLSASHINVGDVLRAQGDLDEALQRFREALEIAQRMNEANPAHAGWLRQLSVSQALVASVLESRGDLDGALRMTHNSLTVLEGLARLDPLNMERQRDLSAGQLQLGSVLEAREDLEGALETYRASLEIARQLAQKDPTNAGWQRDLLVARERVGSVLAERGEIETAFEALRTALGLAEDLTSRFPDQPQFQVDRDRLRQRISALEGTRDDPEPPSTEADR